MALTTHERLRGVMHGVGHAGDRILAAHKDLLMFSEHVPEGVERDIYKNLLSKIEAQAEQLKTTTDE